MITINCKNYPYSRCENKWLFDGISHLFDHSKAFVDIRECSLNIGETPGNGLWHYDSFDGRAENCGNNFLWVSGVSLTEFEDGTSLKPKEWRQYSAELHRAAPAFESGYRLMLRVMELERAPKHRYIKIKA